MSDEPRGPDGHGPGVTGAVSRVSSRLIEALPAQFVVLALISALYTLGVLWFLDTQQERRDRNVAPIIASCLRQVPIEVVERLLKIQIAPIEHEPKP